MGTAPSDQDAELAISPQTPLFPFLHANEPAAPQGPGPTSRCQLRFTASRLSFIANWPLRPTSADSEGPAPPFSYPSPSEETLPSPSFFLNKMKSWQQRGKPTAGGAAEHSPMTLVLDLTVGVSL